MRLQDSSYLAAVQYRDRSNLTARQRLHQTCSQAETPWSEFVFALMRLPTASRILEVGCGPADLWVENAARIPSGWRVTLTDLSQGMVAATRVTTAGIGVVVAVLAADAANLPFGSASFEAVVANHMLYHLPDLPRALTEFHRVLVPDGRLIAATNGPGHLRELRDLRRLYQSEELAAGVGTAFNLANGPDRLRPWFSQIAVHRHNNRLLVTDPELVIDYLCSVPDGRPPAWAERRIRSRLERVIAVEGFWEISSEAGVITARSRADRAI